MFCFRPEDLAQGTDESDRPTTPEADRVPHQTHHPRRTTLRDRQGNRAQGTGRIKEQTTTTTRATK